MSIEYTAVEDDASYSHGGLRGDSQPSVMTSSTSPMTLDTSDRDGSSMNRTEGTNVQRLEPSQKLNEGVLGSSRPPTINGWPQGPRKLGKVSMLFLVGDILLLLLPVAFLGAFDPH